MATKKITTTVYITEEQNQLLKELNKRTKVPVAEFIREGIDLILEKNRSRLPGQIDLSPTEFKAHSNNSNILDN
ncbi:MAG: ribbon-helix-helix domain-containing protein [Oligoflexia bacterium]|nr:ribbon-helix-helix domain-containing protein [Oligoflexia bacterium]